MVVCVMFKIRPKLKDFGWLWWYAKENDAWNLVIFACTTANMAVIANTSDNWTLSKQNLVSALCFAAVRCY